MESEEVVKLKNAVNDRDHTQGPANAVVTLVEYGNFECIDCGRAYPSIKKVRRLLGDKLRLVYRHFPTVRTHPHSLRAAEAAEAAAAQGRFWEMHDALFMHQQALDDPHLMRYAKSIGLNLEQFDHDFNEHAFLKRIEDDYQFSLFDEHITGTTPIYINGLRYSGLTDSESLLVVIKRADTDNKIQLPQTAGSIRGLLQHLRHQGR